MRRIRDKLRGSTLVETLVMMLVAGIVFLTAMDGLTLFSRLQARRVETLMSAGRQTDGYYRAVALITGADSIRLFMPGQLELFRQGRSGALTLSDSTVVYHCGDFRDTLLGGIGALLLEAYPGLPDTVAIGFGVGFTAKFPVRSAAREYDTTLDETEETYGYEE